MRKKNKLTYNYESQHFSKRENRKLVYNFLKKHLKVN